MQFSAWRRVLGVVNVALGGLGTMAGVLAWAWAAGLAYFATLQVPPRPISALLPVAIPAFVLTATFATVALSGVGLVRGRAWGFPAAVAACLLSAACAGTLPLLLSLAEAYFPVIVSPPQSGVPDDVQWQMLLYGGYAAVSALMLWLGRARLKAG